MIEERRDARGGLRRWDRHASCWLSCWLYAGPRKSRYTFTTGPTVNSDTNRRCLFTLRLRGPERIVGHSETDLSLKLNGYQAVPDKGQLKSRTKRIRIFNFFIRRPVRTFAQCPGDALQVSRWRGGRRSVVSVTV
jgi:hypothetical protein